MGEVVHVDFLDDIFFFLKLRATRVNLLIFILFSVILTLLAEQMPRGIYNYKKWLYRERKWEEGGRIYERVFFVKKWKSRLPDIGDFLKWRFSKKHLAGTKSDYLYRFLIESCKAELTHWMIILSSFLFIFWGGLVTFSRILLLAAMLNGPYIIIQRYNRPRLVRLLKNSCQHLELAPAKA